MEDEMENIIQNTLDIMENYQNDEIITNQVININVSNNVAESNKTKKEKKIVKNLTHFFNFPIEDSHFISSFEKLCEELKILSESGLLELDYSLFQKGQKLHITICVLSLDTQDKINSVIDMMEKIEPEIKKIVNQKIYFNFEKYERMGSNCKTRVVYAKMIEDCHHLKILEIIHLIIKALLDENIIDYEELKEYSIKFDKKLEKFTNLIHLTLMNISFLNRHNKKQKKKPRQVYGFNTDKLFEILNEKPLPSAVINRINFCKMSSGQDGKYEEVKCINFN